MIVLDANIVIRGVLGRRVRQIVESYAARGVRFFAPVAAFNDAQKYLPGILKKRGKVDVDVEASLDYLKRLIEPVEPDRYALFESEARERLLGRDEDDWPVLACAIALACGIWTEDTDFFGTGVAIWTTIRIEIFLKAASNRLEEE
jgi:predicted nucleic acid-binding protein